ncbi:MAG: radical SAM family heme chaperone HemW [Hydrogenothermaceae bacterium]|nr:radical SAM family heme chaperone HemW [Hydrogenothermaceae bacterium]
MIEGVYIHVPFCSLKCPYCDFTSFVSFDEELYKHYVDTLLKELLMYREKNFSVKTIYFGGGTPSLLPPSLIYRVLDFIFKNFKTESELEITLEVNPNSYSKKEFKSIKQIGINRLSFGSQSLIEKNLRALGRDHKPTDTVRSVYGAVESGIENINLDFIYGVPNQSLKEIEEDLKLYTALPITHISAYMLTAYDETPLGVVVKKGYIELPDEEESYKMFKVVDQFLEDRGFKRYEISNWAKDGYECRHNISYWKHLEFLGVGVSAWSFIGYERFGNTKNINQYLEAVNRGEKAVILREFLDEEKIREERVFLGLRLREGIELNLIRNLEFLKEIVSRDYVKVENNRLTLSHKGIMVLNYIASRLI